MSCHKSKPPFYCSVNGYTPPFYSIGGVHIWVGDEGGRYLDREEVSNLGAKADPGGSLMPRDEIRQTIHDSMNGN